VWGEYSQEYWGGCPVEELEQSYSTVVKEFYAAKRLTGSSTLLSVVGFFCKGDATEHNPIGGSSCG
jgi:hypothetical protein